MVALVPAVVLSYCLGGGDVGGAYDVFKRSSDWFGHYAVVSGCGWMKVGVATALWEEKGDQSYVYFTKSRSVELHRTAFW